MSQYIGDVSLLDPKRLNRAVAASAPGSPARAYARARLQSAEASIGTYREGPYDSKVKPAGHGFKVCYAGEGAWVCGPTQWANFESVNGKISAFTVGDTPIKDEVWAGHRTVVKAGRLGTVEFVSAYREDGLSLVVTVRVHSKAIALKDNLVEAQYCSPAGGKPEETAGAFRKPRGEELPIAPHATTNATMFFDYRENADRHDLPCAGRGGHVVMTLESSDGSAKRTVAFKVGA